MEPAYFLLAGRLSEADIATAKQVARAHGLTCCLAEHDLLLFIGDSRHYLPIDNGRGAILGPLFSSGTSPVLETRLSSSVEARVMASAGQHLIDTSWGAWIAILRDPIGRSVHIVRDPSPAAACYIAQRGKLWGVASNARLLVAATGVAGKVDWVRLAGALTTSQARPAATCIDGISELMPGHRLSLSAGSASVSCCWSPWAFANRANAIARPDDAAELLRAVILAVTAGWSSLHRHLLLSVSGGLDSSIVAAALNHVGAAFSGITMATEDPSGDERPYARAMLSALDVPLFERFEELTLVDLEVSDAAEFPRPSARAFLQSSDRQMTMLASECCADGFMHGGGGDSVFCMLYSVAPLADRILTRGPGIGAFRTARDLSHQTGTSMLEMCRRGLAMARKGDHSYHFSRDQSFLGAGAITRSAVEEHPWMVTPTTVLPGKARHVAWIVGIHNLLEGYARARHWPIRAPLLSQPLVELCLTIPSWMWCLDGENRAVARRAFADLLPTRILQRRVKGTPSGFSIQLLDSNRARIREMLLDGMLAKAHMLDRSSIESFFRDDRPVSGTHAMRIMRLVDTEAWVRSWNR